jgi:hypothetical protein
MGLFGIDVPVIFNKFIDARIIKGHRTYNLKVPINLSDHVFQAIVGKFF